jgi:hypothetical protein
MESALRTITRLLGALQALHADVQLRMLRVDAAQAGRPAFLALAAEPEALWEPLFRDIAQLCASAMSSRSNTPVIASLNAMGEEVTEQASAEAALLDALVEGCANRDGIVRGGELSLELLTRVRGMLHQLRLAPLDAYLLGVSGAISLLVGNMAGCADAMREQVRRTAAAREVLAAVQAGVEL